MRQTNASSAIYQPGDPPADPAQLQRYLREEIAKISVALAALAAGHFDKISTPPAKPRDGDIRYADGVAWKPNGTGGAGIWYFNASTWIQLG